MQSPTLSLDHFLANLPGHLQERCRRLDSNALSPRGVQVTYWTHHALRCDENPALDIAYLLAKAACMPLVVYQGLSSRYRFASDRHHTFILEAAAELKLRYSELGIAYELFVETRDENKPRLAQLARHSLTVVTDDFPLESTADWMHSIADRLAVPVVAVDTACVVPMQLVGRAYDRAFAFRNATSKLYRARLDRAWPETVPKSTFANDSFQLTLETSNAIARQVAQCKIDHSIGPVADTRGGTTAGYARWSHFRASGLRAYAKRRNAIEQRGVSRMSAYLHYGMVSPFRIAREASEDNADKYLDELLIWRELAYSFCFYRRNVDSTSALPDWARLTLEQHTVDARDILSWERLVKGTTGDRLWDAAQQSLVRHGELHNNVRMTWGKAILQWSPNVEVALARTIDLNHRFALDGRDPASYGGILWCFGQFDRPFSPEAPIFGSVRPRPLEEHAKRVDLDAYEKIVHRSCYAQQPKVAIVGAGLAGLMCAQALEQHGLDPMLFDKSYRPGGRSCSRRSRETSASFDHGAQYFTQRDPRLKPWVDAWTDEGVIAPWQARFGEIDIEGRLHSKSNNQDDSIRYVGTPCMESLAEHLSRDLRIVTETAIDCVTKNSKGKYCLLSTAGEAFDDIDIVLLNMPPIQAAKLCPPSVGWRRQLDDVVMLPCWATMIAFEEIWTIPVDGLFVNRGKTSWLARDSSKPRREPKNDRWVIHSSSQWAQDNLELTPEEVCQEIIAELQTLHETKIPAVSTVQAHRWLYARPREPLGDEAIWDDESRIGCCGDWCGGPRVEGALLSGLALAGRILGTLHSQSNFELLSEATNGSVLAQKRLF